MNVALDMEALWRILQGSSMAEGRGAFPSNMMGISQHVVDGAGTMRQDTTGDSRDDWRDGIRF